MDDILKDYLTICRIDLSKHTLAAYQDSYRSFQRYLDETAIDLKKIKQSEVQGYIGYRSDLKASTLKTHVKAVRAAFNYARNCTLTVKRYDDPFVRLRYPQVSDSEPVTFTNEEIQRLFDAIETDREWLCFHLFAYAGLRRAEVCELTWDDVDFQNRHIVVRGKGNKLRRVPMHPKLAEALAPKRGRGSVLKTQAVAGHFLGFKEKGTKLDPDSLHATNAKWYKRAGVEKGNHCFRRTMNSVLKEKGVSTEDRERIMGWAPRDVQGRHYTRFLDATLHDAIRRLDYKIPKGEPHLKLVAGA